MVIRDVDQVEKCAGNETKFLEEVSRWTSFERIGWFLNLIFYLIHTKNLQCINEHCVIKGILD